MPGSTSITVTAADHAETAEQPDNHDAGTNGSELRIGKFGYIADVLGLVFALCFLGLFARVATENPFLLTQYSAWYLHWDFA